MNLYLNIIEVFLEDTANGREADMSFVSPESLALLELLNVMGAVVPQWTRSSVSSKGPARAAEIGTVLVLRSPWQTHTSLSSVPLWTAMVRCSLCVFYAMGPGSVSM